MEEINEIIVEGVEKKLSGTDRIAILRTEGDHVRYSLISSGVECALKRFVTKYPIRRCELLTRKICKNEFVLLRKVVKENCTVQPEFCTTHHRKVAVNFNTIMCQQNYDLSCNDTSENSVEIDSDIELKFMNETVVPAEVENSEKNETCLPRSIAICRSIPEQVTTTELKQKCNGESEYRTTKICMTYPDGSGDCKSLKLPQDDCDDTDEVKIVSNEISSRTEVQCSRSSNPDQQFCYPSNCDLTDVRTDCINDTLPMNFELKEVVCEKCVEGRMKIRPVIEEREICRDKTENFCLDIEEKEEKWKKWCRKLKNKYHLAKINLRPRQPKKEIEEIEEDETDEPEALYRIEITPGEWVSTSNRTEVDILLEKQKEKENEYEKKKQKEQEEQEEKERKKKEEEEKKSFIKDNLTACLYDPKNCKF